MSDSLREKAEVRLKQFWADAVTRAGGTEQLAARLAESGAVGREGRYHPKTIEAWRGGRRQPGAEVLFVVAAALGMSLDHYVFGRAIEVSEPALAEEVRRLRERQGTLTSWLLEIDERFQFGFAARVSSLDEPAVQERAG